MRTACPIKQKIQLNPFACSSVNTTGRTLFVGASASTMLSSAEFICLRVVIARSSGRNLLDLHEVSVGHGGHCCSF